MFFGRNNNKEKKKKKKIPALFPLKQGGKMPKKKQSKKVNFSKKNLKKTPKILSFLKTLKNKPPPKKAEFQNYPNPLEKKGPF